MSANFDGGKTVQKENIEGPKSIDIGPIIRAARVIWGENCSLAGL